MADDIPSVREGLIFLRTLEHWSAASFFVVLAAGLDLRDRKGSADDKANDLVKDPRLPFRDGSQKIIYSAHLIEHLPRPTLAALLRECHRVLAPGGRIRLECPDAETLVSLYKSSDTHLLSHFREYRRRVVVEGCGADEKFLEDHLTLLGEFSSYIIPGHSFHMPVYASREEFDEKFNSLDLEEFAAWCISLQTPEQRRSGGHQNVLYFSKLKEMLEEAGFADVIPAPTATPARSRVAAEPGSSVERPCKTPPPLLFALCRGDEAGREAGGRHASAAARPDHGPLPQARRRHRGPAGPLGTVPGPSPRVSAPVKVRHRSGPADEPILQHDPRSSP